LTGLFLAVKVHQVLEKNFEGESMKNLITFLLVIGSACFGQTAVGGPDGELDFGKMPTCHLEQMECWNDAENYYEFEMTIAKNKFYLAVLGCGVDLNSECADKCLYKINIETEMGIECLKKCGISAEKCMTLIFHYNIYRAAQRLAVAHKYKEISRCDGEYRNCILKKKE
jgi:hypothetical protein